MKKPPWQFAQTRNIGGSSQRPAPVLQYRHGKCQQQKGDEIRTIECEWDGHSGSRTGRRQRPVEASAPPPCDEPDKSAEARQQQGAEHDYPCETAGAPDCIEQHLRQPLVGQVEPACDRFARVSFTRSRSGERKWIGHGEGVMLRNILACFQVPPEIGVVNLPVRTSPAIRAEPSPRQSPGA